MEDLDTILALSLLFSSFFSMGKKWSKFMKFVRHKPPFDHGEYFQSYSIRTLFPRTSHIIIFSQ